MNWGLGVRITNRSDGTTQDRVFGRFPVRIGRNSLNDLALEYGFVSQFHLVIELQNEKLWVRDLGSTNGTYLKNQGRAPTNQPVELSACEFEFTIVSLVFSIYSVPLDQVQAPQASQRRRLGVTSFLNVSKAPDVNAEVGDVLSETHVLYAAYRAAWSELIRSLDRKLAALPPDAKPLVFERISRDYEAVVHEPDFENLCTRQGLNQPGQPVNVNPGSRLEAVALKGVRELAEDFCASAGRIETVESLAGFVDRVQHVLDVFFRAFISLRDGQRQFETDMAVRRPGGTHLRGAESAQSASELSQALLDWRQANTDGINHVESTLADFMIHQVALLNGVMSGVRTLLIELSPTQIEKKAHDPKFNPDGVGIGPLRYKSLWKTLERIHADFTGEDKQVFSVLFGREFAKAYETHFGAGDRSTIRSNDGRSRPTVPPTGNGGRST